MTSAKNSHYSRSVQNRLAALRAEFESLQSKGASTAAGAGAVAFDRSADLAKRALLLADEVLQKSVGEAAMRQMKRLRLSMTV